MTFLCRYDRFVDAFEHVANMTDDVYKVCMYVTIACMYVHKFYIYLATNNPSAQALNCNVIGTIFT